MKKYIGKKEVQAIACTLEQFIKENGRNPYGNKDSLHKMEEVGYKVVYKDGYESWSPKEAFEEAYKPCETFTDRLVIELEELQEKQSKLDSFLDSDKFMELPEKKRVLLQAQYGAMLAYSRILIARMQIEIDSMGPNNK